MLSEYDDIIPELKAENARFAAVFEKHNELNRKIEDVVSGREHLDAATLDKLKKEKLKLKDEAYTMIMAYKQEKGL